MTQRLRSPCGFPNSWVIARTGQDAAQVPQPMQRPWLITSFIRSQKHPVVPRFARAMRGFKYLPAISVLDSQTNNSLKPLIQDSFRKPHLFFPLNHEFYGTKFLSLPRLCILVFWEPCLQYTYKKHVYN